MWKLAKRIDKVVKNAVKFSNLIGISYEIPQNIDTKYCVKTLHRAFSRIMLEFTQMKNLIHVTIAVNNQSMK